MKKLFGSNVMLTRILFIICTFLIPAFGHSAVVFSENFEYDRQAENLSVLESIAAFRSNWNGDNQEGDGTLGVISTQSSIGQYSGNVQTGTGASTHFEANYSYGSNYYIDMRIYPLSSSIMSNNNKLIYPYTSATGGSIWCLKVSRNLLRTGNCSFESASQNVG